MNSKIKIALIVLIAFAVIGGGVGYYMYNKPVASIENKKADFALSANELVTAFDDDENAAGQLYNEKIIEVNGVISEVTNDGTVNKVFLESDNPMSGVICEMEEGQDVAGVTVGEEVKIKGRCTGYLSDVVLVQSSMVK